MRRTLRALYMGECGLFAREVLHVLAQRVLVEGGVLGGAVVLVVPVLEDQPLWT
ncbi:hypothetical protein [Arthrobacter sp. N199823]|uniref:hypothetical protein n=1 Tax=Micrococcaceae TaxID=1268 RepID=UPI001CA4DC44|nr:hypothetical protein [Arthrobacter sp. N199823]